MKTFFTSLTGFATILSLLTSAQAAPNSTDGPSCGAAKVDDSYFSVVGVQGTGVHPRQELRELAKDTELWNIFLQAFSRFQGMDQNEKISYYQVAGQRYSDLRGRHLANTIQGYTECLSSNGIMSLEHQAMK
jgi:tyrosinase